MQELGFLVNWDKSVLDPSQFPTFLGADIDLPGQLARPSTERIARILAAARALRRSPHATALTWLKFLGHLASLVDVLPDCRLHMCQLQIHVLRYYLPNVDAMSRRIPRTPFVAREIERWLSRIFLAQGKPLRQPQPTITVTTDASLLGWGGVCGTRMVSGDWSHLPTILHINQLEFWAVFLSLQHFRNLLVGRAVLIQTDNVTVAAYINRQGGTHSIPLNALAALPIPSHGEQAAMNLGPLQVDLFASSLNNPYLPRYCSMPHAGDPRAWKIDAFSFNWGKIRAYAFPPIAMIPLVLRKIRQDQATVLLIAPWWPKRTWFLEGVSLLMDSPRSLPIRQDLLLQPLSGTLHHDPGCLHLTVWPLSGKIVERQDFQTALQSSSPAVTETQPESLMPGWRVSTRGVTNREWIPVLPL